MRRLLDKNEEIVKYIVERASGRVGRVRLMKYAYLADLECRRYLGRPLSTFRYKLHHYGPFDRTLYDVLESLKAAHLIAEEQYPWQGTIGYAYHNVSEPVAFSLSPAERFILDFVIEGFEQHDMDRLLEDTVYETPPVKNAKPGEVLNMEGANNEMKQKLGGIDLERVLVAERQISEGRYTDLESVLKELESARSRGREATTS